MVLSFPIISCYLQKFTYPRGKLHRVFDTCWSPSENQSPSVQTWQAQIPHTGNSRYLQDYATWGIQSWWDENMDPKVSQNVDIKCQKWIAPLAASSEIDVSVEIFQNPGVENHPNIDRRPFKPECPNSTHRKLLIYAKRRGLRYQCVATRKYRSQSIGRYRLRPPHVNRILALIFETQRLGQYFQDRFDGIYW